METGKLDLKRLNNKTLGMTQVIELLKYDVQSFDTTENRKLLDDCQRYWESLRDFRERRKRNRKYYRGDQWSDYVVDDDGNSITEEDYIKNQGKVPLKQNMIRQLVKNLIGQYRSNPTKTMVIARAKEDGSLSEMLSNALDAAGAINQIVELDARAWEEFALSGAPIQKVSYQYWPERNIEDLYVENVNVNRVFFNSDVSDIRGHDLRLLGEIIDTTIDDLLENFAKTRKDEKWIRSLYEAGFMIDTIRTDGLDASKLDDLNFLIASEKDKCRLFEVWQKKSELVTIAHDPYEATYEVVPYTPEQIALINDNRILQGMTEGIPVEDIPLIEAHEKYETFWYVKFLTPTGHVLWEGKTPYAHESHPYALKLFPLLDGEVWGLVEDVIDQQRYINRLIIMMDFIISASAKGVLLVPEKSIPDGMDITDFANEWSRFNGVIKYKPDPTTNKVPEQIAANSVNIGIQEMLAYQMQFLQEVSGVHSAIQGKEAKSGTPSSLYAQEAQNATLNSVDYMGVFNSFKEMRDMKALKVISQFYREERYLAIAGQMYKDEAAMYDPKKVKGLDFDVRVTQGQDAPVFRQLIDETLVKLLDAQHIDIEMFLEHTSLPFADKLLQAVKRQREEIQQGIAGQGQLPPEMMEAAGGADPRAMQMLQMATGGEQ